MAIRMEKVRMPDIVGVVIGFIGWAKIWKTYSAGFGLRLCHNSGNNESYEQLKEKKHTSFGTINCNFRYRAY